MGVARASAALPAGLVLAGAISVQSGAGIATLLFRQLPPAAVTTLRLWSAAALLLAVGGRGAARALGGIARRGAWPDAVSTCAFGVTLGFMNFSIYQAFARIPLGIAVTIEFLGPLTVTVASTLAAGRRAAGARPLAARRTLISGLGYAALAAAGVVLLAGAVSTRHLNWAGVAWAVAAGAAWAGYIVASKSAGQRFAGSAGLVLAMCVAAAVVSVPGVTAGSRAMFRPGPLLAGAGVGLLSSVIPYWLELEALRRIPARVFGVWMSVQPAVAALIGLALLSQHLSAAEWTGICCVVAASAGAARSGRQPPESGSTLASARPPNTAVNGALRWARVG